MCHVSTMPPPQYIIMVCKTFVFYALCIWWCLFALPWINILCTKNILLEIWSVQLQPCDILHANSSLLPLHVYLFQRWILYHVIYELVNTISSIIIDVIHMGGMHTTKEPFKDVFRESMWRFPIPDTVHLNEHIVSVNMYMELQSFLTLRSIKC